MHMDAGTPGEDAVCGLGRDEEFLVRPPCNDLPRSWEKTAAPQGSDQTRWLTLL